MLNDNIFVNILAKKKIVFLLFNINNNIITKGYIIISKYKNIIVNIINNLVNYFS